MSVPVVEREVAGRPPWAEVARSRGERTEASVAQKDARRRRQSAEGRHERWQRIEAAARLREQGMRITDIAAKLGVTAGQVSQDLRAYVASANGDGEAVAATLQRDSPSKAEVAERRRLAFEMHAQGKTLREIGAVFGISESAVCRYIQREHRRRLAEARSVIEHLRALPTSRKRVLGRLLLDGRL